MVCDTATFALDSTNSGFPVTCVVAEVVKGSLITGDFKLSVTSPNAYISTPVAHTVPDAYPWNIDAAHMAAAIGAEISLHTNRSFALEWCILVDIDFCRTLRTGSSYVACCW